MNEVENILIVENLITGYENKPILKNINLSLDHGEICSIIGEEGSGKTTLLKALTRQIKFSGKAHLGITNIRELSTDQMVKIGIDFLSQGGNILNRFTVGEHIQLALNGDRKNEKERREEIEEIFPRINQLGDQIAGRLSGGERIMLSLSCMIATNANFWILDEPTAGLAPEICSIIKDFIIKIKNITSKTMMILEHNYVFAFEISDSVVVLKDGQLSKKFYKEKFLQKEFIENELYGK